MEVEKITVTTYNDIRRLITQLAHEQGMTIQNFIISCVEIAENLTFEGYDIKVKHQDYV